MGTTGKHGQGYNEMKMVDRKVPDLDKPDDENRKSRHQLLVAQPQDETIEHGSPKSLARIGDSVERPKGKPGVYSIRYHGAEDCQRSAAKEC